MTEKVSEILEKIGDCYNTLAAHYEAMEHDTMQSERVAQVSRYLSEWERVRAVQLNTRLKDSGYKDVLATWLKERPSVPNDLDISSDDFEFKQQLTNEVHTEESLMAVLSKRHNFIADTYRKLVTVVSCEKLQELFTTLADDELLEVKRAIRNIQAFEFV